MFQFNPFTGKLDITSDITGAGSTNKLTYWTSASALSYAPDHTMSVTLGRSVLEMAVWSGTPPLTFLNATGYTAMSQSDGLSTGWSIGQGSSGFLNLNYSGGQGVILDGSGTGYFLSKIGIGVDPNISTGSLEILSGTATTPPIKLNSGTLTTGTDILAGNIEFLTDKYYATITTGAARKELALNDIALTSGRVPYTTTNGRFTDNSNFLYTSSGNNRLVINGSGTPVSAVFSDFVLSIQSIGSDYSWLEILNNGGQNKGAFFGMALNQFQLFNWQGGDIEFWTGLTTTDGTRYPRVTISVDGNLGLDGANQYGWGHGWGGGKGVLALANAHTAPTTSLTTALGLYSVSQELWYMSASNQARKVVASTAALTSGRVPIVTTGGLLTDDADLTFATDTLSATKVAMSSLTSGRVPIVSTSGLLIDDADLTFATDTLTATKVVGTTSVKVGTAAGYISSDGSTGATGTFSTADGYIVTVKDGIITAITP